MTIPYRIVLAKSLSSKEKTQLHKQILAVFHTIDTTYNNWNPDSEISKINRAPAHLPLQLSIELSEFLKQVDTLYTLSHGRFDPTLGALKTLWLLHLKQHTTPQEELWKASIKETGWDKLKIDFQAHTLTKTSSLHLDLCGIVKGYAVDRLLETCQKFCKNAYVEWGGEIKTSGKHPSGRAWQVFSEAKSSIIQLENCAIATSGSSCQHWCVEGKVYTHILNHYTGKSLEEREHPLQAVSVVHPNCAYADALATVLMTFSSKEEALAWAKIQGICAYINDSAS